MQTRKQLRDQILAWLDQVGDTSTTKTVVDDTLRRMHRVRLTERKWNFMLWNELQTLTTVVNQRFYSLHQEFFRPLFFFNRTSKRLLAQATTETLVPSGYSQLETDYDTGFGLADFTQATGSAWRYHFGGNSPVIAQPTSASVLTVTGEAARTVTVRGDTADGVTEETITVGTPGAVQFTRILGVAKGDGWTQTMTLTSNSGAVTNLKLFASEVGRQYRTIELLTTPTAAETLVYKFYRRPGPFNTDNALPDIPAEFAEVLVYDTLLELALYNDQLKGSAHQHWRSEQSRLEHAMVDYDDGADALGASVVYQDFTPRD